MFDLKEDETCGDRLMIHDKANSKILKEKLCGTEKPEDILTESNSIEIIFESDSQEQRKGFRIVWGTELKKTSDNEGKTTQASFLCKSFLWNTNNNKQV